LLARPVSAGLIGPVGALLRNSADDGTKVPFTGECQIFIFVRDPGMPETATGLPRLGTIGFLLAPASGTCGVA
jgi:hypothetical protein